MEKLALTFAIFLACFSQAASNKFPANELKGFAKKHPDVRRHLSTDREDHTTRKLLQTFIGNKEPMLCSSSWIQFARERLGLASRSVGPKMSNKAVPKVSWY